MESKPRYLSDESPVDIREYLSRDDRVILVFGSIENNGPHLPLATDLLVAVALAEAASRATGVLIAPPIPWGVSSVNMGFPGTLTLSPGTCERIITELCMSVAFHGFQRVALISGHSSNVWPAANAAELLRDRGVLVAQLDVWRCVEKLSTNLAVTDAHPFGHGSEMMTSVMLSVAPHLVHADRMEPEMPVDSFGLKYYGTYPRIMGFAAWDDVSTSGSIGDPRSADAKRGEEALQRMTSEFVELLEDMRSAPLPSTRTFG